MEIIRISVSDDIISRARARYDKRVRKVYNSRSYNGGRNVLDSMVSEQVVSEYYNKPIQDTYDYDFVTSSGVRIDLKTKSKSDLEPEPYWYCMVPEYQVYKQECDYYIFNRINKRLDVVWILGYMSKEEFIKNSINVKRGEILPDKEGSRDWECWTDGYYMTIEKLHSMKGI